MKRFDKTKSIKDGYYPIYANNAFTNVNIEDTVNSMRNLQGFCACNNLASGRIAKLQGGYYFLTFELIEQYFNSNQYDCEKKVIVDYVLNGTTIKIQYKKYVEWITKEGKDESWWDYDNYIEVELLDYITFLFNLKK